MTDDDPITTIDTYWPVVDPDPRCPYCGLPVTMLTDTDVIMFRRHVAHRSCVVVDYPSERP